AISDTTNRCESNHLGCRSGSTGGEIVPGTVVSRVRVHTVKGSGCGAGLCGARRRPCCPRIARGGGKPGIRLQGSPPVAVVVGGQRDSDIAEVPRLGVVSRCHFLTALVPQDEPEPP